jgi:hypothetical protein
MYNYSFKDEKVIFEKVDSLVEFNDKCYTLNILVTTKNLLLFKNINDDFLKRKSIGVFATPEYELVFKMLLNDISYSCESGDTILNNENIILLDIDLSKIITK